MSRKLYDACVSTGEYHDQQGQKRKRWQTIGAVFENDDGKLSMKLETIPVGAAWSGWISFFEPKEKQPAQGQPQRKPQGTTATTLAPGQMPERFDTRKPMEPRAELNDSDFPF